MKNILVIGASGFVGKHLIQKLLYDYNGLHAPISVSRIINIPSAGLYPIAALYHQMKGIKQCSYTGRVRVFRGNLYRMRLLLKMHAPLYLLMG